MEVVEFTGQLDEAPRVLPFSGELDAPGKGVVAPFDGPLDPPASRGPADDSDPMLRVTPSASGLNLPISADGGITLEPPSNNASANRAAMERSVSPESVMFTTGRADQRVDQTIARGENLAKALKKGGYDSAEEFQQAQRSSKQRAKFAEDNPLTGALASGLAGQQEGLANAVPVLADFVNKTFVNPVLNAAGADSMPAVPKALGTQYLQGLQSDYMPAVGKMEFEEVAGTKNFGPWLLSQMASNSPQMIMSLAAAVAPPLRATILPTMGATTTGQNWAQGDDPRIAVAKGMLEAGTEMLPLGVFDKIQHALLTMPRAARHTALAEMGKKTLAGLGAVGASHLTEGSEEWISQVGGNLLDKYAGGKNVPLDKGAAGAYVAGAASGGAMGAPHLATLAQDNTPQGQVERELARSLNEGQLAPLGSQADLNPNLRAAKPDPIAAIQSASNVDEAIAAAVAAVSPAGAESSINAHVESDNVSTGTEVQSRIARPNPVVGGNAATSVLAGGERTDAAPAGLPAGDVASAGPADAVNDPANSGPSPEFAALVGRIAELEAQGEVGMPEPADPDGSAPARNGPPTLEARLNDSGTLTIRGDEQAIRSLLQQAGISQAIRSRDGFLVGVSQAQRAATAVQDFTGTARPAAPQQVAPTPAIAKPGPVAVAPAPAPAPEVMPRATEVRPAAQPPQDSPLTIPGDPKAVLKFLEQNGITLAIPMKDGVKVGRSQAQQARQLMQTLRAGDADSAAATWFGRRGDGYVTEGDALMALPGRQKVEPSLKWRVEPMPSGKFRLAGYAEQAVGPELRQSAAVLPPTLPKSEGVANKPETISAFPGEPAPGSSTISAAHGADIASPAINSGENAVSGSTPDMPKLSERERVSAMREAAQQRKQSEATAKAERRQAEMTKARGGQSSEEVSRYVGKYGKGMGREAAKLEASRLNRRDDGVTYTAEEHGDAKLENSWAVVGRKAAQPASEQSTEAPKQEAEGKVAGEPVRGSDEGSDSAMTAMAEKRKESPAADAPATPAKIEDSGEVLEGARKFYAKAYADKVAEGMGMDTATVPLSKSWPEPDYQRLLDDGADPWAVAFVRAARDEVPAKPSKGWKVNGWVKKVELLRDFAAKALDGQHPKEMLKAKGEAFHLENWFNKIDLYEAVGHAQSLKDFKLEAGSYGMYGGEKFDPPKLMWSITSTDTAKSFGNWGKEWAVGDSKAEAIAKFKAALQATPVTPEAKAKTSFDIYSYRGKDEFVIGKKTGKNYLDLKTFPTAKDAREYLAANQAELERLLAEAKEIPPERRATNEPRVGADHRDSGNVTSEQFRETFGFRGEQFGASMPQDERQNNLNQAYDALMDLAGVIGVPPKALSLNGELGLAFGARGHGGTNPAAAHYERDTIGAVTPNRVVINLTRKNGAGSLAHEWFHAVDNYFARMRGEKGGMVSEKPYERGAGVRPEMVQAFKQLMGAINDTSLRERSKNLDKKRTKEYWSTGLEMAARSFESYVIAKLHDQSASNDYLANIVSEQEFGRENQYPYPTAGEVPAVRAAFDNFFSVVETKETDAGVAMFKRGDKGPGLGAEAVRQAIAEPLSKLVIPHTIHETVADARDEIGVDIPDGAKGMHYKGEIHLFADGIRSPLEAEQVFWHEVQHAGLIETTGRGKEYEGALRDLSMKNRNIREAAKAWMTKFGEADYRDRVDSAIEAAEKRGQTVGPAERKRIEERAMVRTKLQAVDEALAELSGGNTKINGIAKFIAKVQEVMRSLGLHKLANALEGKTDAEALAMILRSRDAVMGGKAAQGGELAPSFSRSNPENVWSVPEPTKTDKLLYETQDGRIDLKRAHEAITAAGREIEERFDARLAETLYPGRVAYRSQQFLTGEVRALLESIALNKVTIDEISDYLIARHAPERNAQVARVNPDMPDGGAGRNSKGELMTTKTAEQYIAGLEPQRRKVLENVAAKVDKITAGTRQLLVDEGLEKPEVVKAWESAYQNYAPLYKDEAQAGTPHPIGTGFNVKGQSSKRATGSTKRVTDVLGHVLMQREAAITRAEKNRVALALYGMALSHPNREFWTTIKPGMSEGAITTELEAMGVPEDAREGMDAAPTITTVDSATGQVAERPNPLYKNLPGAITVKLAGEDRVIMLNANNERAARLAENLKNLDGLTKLDLAGSIVGQATRWIASVNTRFNVAFGFVNAIRDLQSGIVNLTNTPLHSRKAKVFGNVPAAIVGIARDIRGDSKRTEWSDLYVQFQKDGGQTGYRDMFHDAADRTRAIEKELAALESAGKLTPGKAVHAVLDLLGDFNDAIENGIRLSAYKAGLDDGLSGAAAARIARELTVDFNRRGRAGRELSPLYAFLNASIQGTARTLATLKGPSGAKIIAAGLGLGVLQALLLAAAGFEDDDIPEWVKARNLIIPTGWRSTEKRYIAIPLGLGLNVLPNTGRVLAELVLYGDKDMGKRLVNAVGEIAGAINPMGGGNVLTPDGALRTIAPTVLDPLIELGFNKSFSGNQIERRPFNEEGDNRPGYARARESTMRTATGQVYLAISKAINSLAGGTKFEAGAVSPTPERVRYLTETVGGGALREFEKAVNASVNAANGQPVRSTALPLAGRFVGAVDENAVEQSRYFESKHQIDKAQSSLRAAEKAGDATEYRKILKATPEVKIYSDLQATQKSIRELNRMAVETIDNPAQMQRIDAQRAEEMRRLNSLLKRMEKAEPTLADRLKGDDGAKP